MNNSIAEQIIKKVEKNDDLAVFGSKDFLEIASYDTVRRVLNKMAARGDIKKIMRALYYRPRFSELLQEYEVASPHQVAMAIARKFNWNIAPTGSGALNMLGLSTQVPSKWSYISDGVDKNIKFENISIEFKRRNNREISGMSYKTALVIQGLKALGKDNVSKADIDKIRELLTEKERKELLAEGKSTLAWIFEIIKKICGGNADV